MTVWTFLAGFFAGVAMLRFRVTRLRRATAPSVTGLFAAVGRGHSLLVHSPVNGTVRQFPDLGLLQMKRLGTFEFFVKIGTFLSLG